MTIYFIVYWMNSVPTFAGAFASQAAAQNAYNWFVTLQGIQAVQISTVTSTAIETFGTIPS